jgi:hypothetical protein
MTINIVIINNTFCPKGVKEISKFFIAALFSFYITQNKTFVNTGCLIKREVDCVLSFIL